MQKTILLTGATGMVGYWVLKEVLNNDAVTKVISIGRRKSGVEHKKLTEVLHDNFLDFSPLKEQLAGIDLCIYCIGVYQGQVPKDKFFEITCDYQKALTDVLQTSSPQLTFVLFGASGADPTEKSRALFAKAKGRAEALLNATSFPKKYIFRPGYIHPTGTKKPSGMAYKIVSPIGGGLLKLFPGMGILDRELARVMVQVGLVGEEPSRIFSNVEMKEILVG